MHLHNSTLKALNSEGILQRSNHWLGAFYRRKKAHAGPLVATKATARKMAVVFYKMVKLQVEFNPIPMDLCELRFKERKLKYMTKEAAKMRMELVPC